MSQEPTAASSAESEPETAAGKAQIVYDDFARVDLRVATILAAEDHPNADRLLKLQVDLGDLGPRQVCAGIRGRYEPAELVGKQVVVVANLKPRRIRGEDSNGMILAASHTDGDELKDIILLQPVRSTPPGSVVS